MQKQNKTKTNHGWPISYQNYRDWPVRSPLCGQPSGTLETMPPASIHSMHTSYDSPCLSLNFVGFTAKEVGDSESCFSSKPFLQSFWGWVWNPGIILELLYPRSNWRNLGMRYEPPQKLFHKIYCPRYRKLVKIAKLGYAFLVHKQPERLWESYLVSAVRRREIEWFWVRHNRKWIHPAV